MPTRSAQRSPALKLMFCCFISMISLTSPVTKATATPNIMHHSLLWKIAATRVVMTKQALMCSSLSWAKNISFASFRNALKAPFLLVSVFFIIVISHLRNISVISKHCSIWRYSTIYPICFCLHCPCFYASKVHNGIKIIVIIIYTNGNRNCCH